MECKLNSSLIYDDGEVVMSTLINKVYLVLRVLLMFFNVGGWRLGVNSTAFTEYL